MGLTFDSYEDYFTSNFPAQREATSDLRYLFDALAMRTDLVWITRCDPSHLWPQLTGIEAYTNLEPLPIENRLLESPQLDEMDWYLVTAELNRRNQRSDRDVDIRANEHHAKCAGLPNVSVDYIGRA